MQGIQPTTVLSLRFLQEVFLLKELQVEADPDLPSGNFVQQKPASGRAFALLLRPNLGHRHLSAPQEIWGTNREKPSLPHRTQENDQGAPLKTPGSLRLVSFEAACPLA